MCVDHRAVRPLLRRQEGEISQPPALAAVVVAVVVDRRRQEASLRAGEAAEAEVVRPAVPDLVGGVAAVQAALEAEAEAGVEAEEAEFSPGVTITPEVPHHIARDLTKMFIGFAALVFGSSPCAP
jgi:hypothetical protein